MKKRKQKQYTLRHKKTFWIRIVLFFTVTFAIGVGVFIYQSRGIPDLGENTTMTTLPNDVKHVLADKVGPTSSPEIMLRIPILLYHYVEYVHNDSGKQLLNIPPNILTAQIETLKKAGYVFVTPSNLVLALSDKKKLPEKSVVLSFDDGYMDLFTDVLPILQQEHVKAVAYIVPNLLDRPNYLFTFQLQAVAKSGLIEIGAHTMDHYALAGLHAKEATYEIAQSRKVLQDMLHITVTSFAYPYGSFDLPAIQLVKDAGFTNAVSTIPGIMQSKDNEYFLNRLRPGYRTGQSLLALLGQTTFKPW